MEGHGKGSSANIEMKTMPSRGSWALAPLFSLLIVTLVATLWLSRNLAGPPAWQSEYPATVSTRSPALCAITAVGPTTLLSAGHCFQWKMGKAYIEVVIEGDKYHAVCVADTNFGRTESGEPVNDLAVCVTNKSIAGVAYEVVSRHSFVKDTEVALVGFGCTHYGGATAGRGKVGATNTARNQVRTRGFEVCGGDSGGGAYLDGVIQNGVAVRRLVGVISMEIKDGAILASLETPGLGWPIGVCGVDLAPGSAGCLK